jgi:hypothetical protein
MGYMVSATAKDFTIIMRVAKPKSVSEIKLGPRDQIMEFKGQLYKVRIGVIDLEAKLYTKLPLYIKEVEEAYLNFVKYHFA